jgi:transposase
VLQEAQERLPAHARSALHTIGPLLSELVSEVQRLEAQNLGWHRSDAVSIRLATIPGIGPITASAIVAAEPDATLFRSGRQFATRQPWSARLLTRKSAKIAPVALANKTARVAWAVMARNEVYASAAP